MQSKHTNKALKLTRKFQITKFLSGIPNQTLFAVRLSHPHLDQGGQKRLVFILSLETGLMAESCFICGA